MLSCTALGVANALKYRLAVSKEAYEQTLTATLRDAMREAGRSTAQHTIVRVSPGVTDRDPRSIEKSFERTPFTIVTVRTDHSYKLFDPSRTTCVPSRGLLAEFGRSRKVLCVSEEIVSNTIGPSTRHHF